MKLSSMFGVGSAKLQAVINSVGRRSRTLELFTMFKIVRGPQAVNLSAILVVGCLKV